MGIVVLAVVIVIVAVLASSLVSRTAPAVARLHVDDLVLGRAPAVCAITGEPTSMQVPVESSRGGFQAWWLLLLFLGPVGIAVIAVLYVLGSRGERVSGVLPISPAALEHYNQAVRVARGATIALAGVMVTGVIAVSFVPTETSTPLLVGVGVAAALGLVILGAGIVAPSRWIDLRLDGSGRWVTVERAHPAFAEALRQHYATHQPVS